jgi:two-component system, cell cycle response regulator DivK
MSDTNNTDKSFNFSNKKILLVEDIDSNLKLLIALLKSTNAEILLAEDGSKAIEMCRKRDDIDLVLMDIMLPDISGIEATSTIKTFRKELPIIAQTAYAMAGDKEKCLEAGCDEYISKPISRLGLLNLMAKYLNK